MFADDKIWLIFHIRHKNLSFRTLTQDFLLHISFVQVLKDPFLTLWAAILEFDTSNWFPGDVYSIQSRKHDGDHLNM